MLIAENIEGNLWLVGEEAAAGGIADGRKIAVAAGGGSAEALAAYLEVTTDPSGPQLAAETQAMRDTTARAECSRRIFAVCDGIAQINLAAAAAAGLLTTDQMNTYRTGLAWVNEMRATWPVLAAGDGVIADDANWPAIPPGVAELAALF